MSFLIQSKVLEQLKPKLQQAVELIRESITTKRPILIRHHCDTDGYAAAIALEKAILPLLYDFHTRERDMFYYYTRLPSLTPFYDYSDATKDINNFLEDVSRFEHKVPLIIILDTGSSEQDLFSLKKLKLYKSKVIVIDHHPPFKEIASTVELHVNPHYFGSTYDLCSGMLCVELANMINPSLEQLPFIASVSAVGDKVNSIESKQYLQLAHKDGHTEEFIKQVAEVLDFEAYAIGPRESRELIHDIFGNEPELQKKLVDLIHTEIKLKIKTILDSMLKYVITEEKKNTVVTKINIDEVKKAGEFPPRGKCVGILLDALKQKYSKPVVTMGLTPTGINFRCSLELKKFDVNTIINELRQTLPHAQVEGGGHRVAGSITFIAAAQKEVLKQVETYIDYL